MELSGEDTLRLNVLLANARAIRIDENTLSVYGLSGQGEARVQLNPTGRADRYLRHVRELLSSAVLGSPGGYPVYLKRWTRMGQLTHEHLDHLLMLGEPEAVVAVACSPGLTDELARRAWWALPDAENARRMLERECVVQGAMGRVLADFLVEFLPFEEDPLTIIRTVRLLLQPGLIGDEERLRIWRKGRAKNVFLVGFLYAVPDDLPEPVVGHRDADRATTDLKELCEAGNPFAIQLRRSLSAPGQTFLRTCETVLRKPSNQDVVYTLLDALNKYCAAVRPALTEPAAVVESLCGQVEGWCSGAAEAPCPAPLRQVIDAAPWLRERLHALLTLACCDDRVLRPVLAGTDSMGSLMRKKLEPVTGPLLRLLGVLLEG